MQAEKVDHDKEEYDPLRHAGLYGAKRFKAMSAVLLALLLSVLDYAIANVALPTIASDLHSDASRAIWVVNAYQLASLSFVLPLAAIGNRIGFARMYQFGIALFIVASAFCALSQNMLELALSRALQGIGGSCIMSVNIALVRFIYPHKFLGKGIALNGFFVGLGVSIGPTIGSFILSVASWNWIFWINLPLGALALLLAWLELPQTPCSDVKIDYKGSLLTVVSFATLGVGIDGLMHKDFALGVSLTCLSILSWSCLIRWQKNRVEPIFPLDILKRRPFFIACFVSYCGFIASNLYIVAMPFTLTDGFHKNPATVGLLIAPWAVGTASMSYVIGHFTDRFSASFLSSLGLLITATGFILLWSLPLDASNLDIAWRTLLAGWGFGMFQPPNNRAIMVTAPVGREGSASGMLSVARLGGQTSGALLVAGIFTISAKPAFICLGAAAFVALFGACLSAGRSLFQRRFLSSSKQAVLK